MYGSAGVVILSISLALATNAAVVPILQHQSAVDDVNSQKEVMANASLESVEASFESPTRVPWMATRLY